MARSISGHFAPVPTPLSTTGEFDPGALARHLAWLSARGLDGALILGSNGEFPSLSLDERSAVAESAAAASSGLSLILGVGACALPDVLAMTDLAGRLGFAAILVPPPFYFRTPPPSGLQSFFETVLDRAGLPVLLYNIPQVTGIPIAEILLEAISRHPNLAGVKDSSGMTEEMDRLLPRFADGGYLVGSDRLVSRCLASGGGGSISAAANIVPTLVRAAASSVEAQSLLDRVRGVIESSGLVPSVKAVLRHLGIGDYASRPPLKNLEAAEAEAVVTGLEALLPPSRW